MPQPVIARGRKSERAWARPSTGVTAWDAAVARYLEDRKSSTVDATRVKYAGYLQGVRVQAFLNDHAILSPDQFTADTLADLEHALATAPADVGSDGLASESVLTYITVVKSFLRWCSSRRGGFAMDAEIMGYRLPPVDVVAPPTISTSEERRCLAALESQRDKMIFAVMAHSGLRLAEVHRLNVGNLVGDHKGYSFYVQAAKANRRSRRDRLAPVDTSNYKLSREILKYINNSRPKDVQPDAIGDPMFCSIQRTDNGHYARLSTDGIKSIFKRLQQRTGIAVHPHQLRHTFATRAVNADVPIFHIQHALGHSSLRTTERYFTFSQAKMLNAWGKAKAL
jgi:site-specific recombinase XerD